MRLCSRSTRSYHPPPSKYTASGGVCYKDNGPKTQRTLPPPQSSERQHIQTIHIPKALVAAPFLQHPALTPGQKRYLYSIAKVYSTEHIRRVMQQHYLNVLHRCIDTGHHPLSEIRNEDVNLHLTGKQRMDSGRSTDSKHSADGSLGAVHSGKIILPKISNKQTSKASSTSASNERKSRKRRTNVSMAQSRSVRGKVQFEHISLQNRDDR
ncbi:uncharacterized protein LOC118777696 [Megalops cyprinoides]|uniref:uncharacterized protein LOC118777696 n=1 Tax=Megalops cyprinoides TaxID=118141 RepID=UPI0018655B16|nr:uncharacterized protein LOC118777696 [Megalops cyprinoides]